MKTSLSHLPEKNQEELSNIASIITKATDVEMIILYGSYARGDYVDFDLQYDPKEGHATSYESDFDILVVTSNEKLASDLKLWDKIEKRIIRVVRKFADALVARGITIEKMVLYGSCGESCETDSRV